ncbi:MAG: LON peptidase substrate-binding domain-containing protein [Thermoguttaceae bacterium]|jgi:Lon protease-like protein
MAAFEEFSFSVDSFSGVARIFPLPSLVLFPHVMQPLHIFEPRYRSLLQDAVSGDRLIAMALLAPGWQDDYEGRPATYPIACLSRITTWHQLQDGTYNLLVLGLRRVRLVRELDATKDFREARVELCADDCLPQDGFASVALQRKLRDAFRRVAAMLPEAQEQLDQLLGSDVPLGVLTDVISYMLEIEPAEKEALLAEVNVCRRGRLLLRHLRAMSADRQPARGGALVFPPQFSAN